jgi:hypothetical protein
MPHRITNTISYDLDQIHIMRQSFDAVWQRIEPRLSNRPHSAEFARTKLADAVLRAAQSGVVSTEDLTSRVFEIVQTPPTAICTCCQHSE